MRLLLDRVRVAKEALSDAPEATLQATLSERAADRSRRSTESDFAALTRRWCSARSTPTRKALRDAKVAPAEIKGVVLVGGATRMPVIRRAVETYFGQPPLTNLDPDQVVALGAAIQADLLAGNRARRRRRLAAARCHSAVARR